MSSWPTTASFAAACFCSWDAPLVNDFFAMIFYGLLRHLVTEWCDDRDGALQNDLIGGEGGIVSAEPAVRMQRLAGLASGDPDAAGPTENRKR